MYEKPVLRKFGTFRELTQLGLNLNSDGASICGISSSGCSTPDGNGYTWEIGCDNGPRTS